MTRAGTRRRGRAKGPSLWTLAAALVVIAMVSFTGATRVGGEVARLERAELAALLPGDPAVTRVRAAAVDWQAALDTKLQLLASGDLVAANRVDHAQVEPGFQRLTRALRTTAADSSRAASAAQGRSKAGSLAVLRRGQLEEGRRLLTDAQAALSGEVQSLRRIIATLRPPVLEERGLVSALCDYVEMVRQQAGISCTLAAKLPARLPEDHETVLYRVAQEALTNVARHARASSARVELAGGTWTVWSRPGAGTVLTASLPKALVAA